ncbi:MAG: VWA domain-containing protein [Myxococcales bacterium]
MPKTLALVAAALASLAAAAIAFLLRPTPKPVEPQFQRAGALRMTTQLDHRYLSEVGGGAYLQIDLAADGDASQRRRVPVNAVLILDRSGSMTGPKMDRARDAARALVNALNGEDRLAIVEFSSEASVLYPSTSMTGDARSRALRVIDLLEPMGGTNMSAAFDIAAPELARGHAGGRVDKIFLASDGQANEGISDRAGLLKLAQRDFAGATLSTFGMGEDYDEDLMTAFASQNGGRARYIASPDVLPGAFRDELSRAATEVARNVRVRIRPVAGTMLDRVLGYEMEGDGSAGARAEAAGRSIGGGGWVRLPDFAAGEERRVLAKLQIPAGTGLTSVAAVELQFDDVASGSAQHAEANAQVTLTADRALQAVPATEAAAEGAKAEMAVLAQQAALDQEQGRRAEALARIAAMRAVAVTAARAVPGAATPVMQAATDYARDVDAIRGAGDAQSKQLKQKAFDAVRAPKAGW